MEGDGLVEKQAVSPSHPSQLVAWSAPGESGKDGIEETHAGAVAAEAIVEWIGGAPTLSRPTLPSPEDRTKKKQARASPIQARRDLQSHSR